MLWCDWMYPIFEMGWNYSQQEEMKMWLIREWWHCFGVIHTHRHTSSICCFWHGQVSHVSSGNYGDMASHTQPSIIQLTHTASPHSLQMRTHTPCQNTHTSLSGLIRFSIHASRIDLGITLLRIQPSRGGLLWLVWRANKDMVFGGNSCLNLCNSLKSQPEIQTHLFLTVGGGCWNLFLLYLFTYFWPTDASHSRFNAPPFIFNTEINRNTLTCCNALEK